MGTLQIATILLAVTGAGETVLLDFQAPWCGPCQSMEPHIQRLAEAGYPVRKIDVDQNQDIARRYGVQSIPCFVLVVNGQEQGRVVGMATPERLEQLFTTAGVQPAGTQPAITRGQSPERRGLFGFGRGSSQPPTSSATAIPPLPEQLTPTAVRIEPGMLVAASSTENPNLHVPAHRPQPVRPTQPAAQPRAPLPPASQASFTAPRPPVATHQPPATRQPATPRMPVATATADPVMDRIMAASVRLHVTDPDGTSHGSGTIIDAVAPSATEQGQALILTCAHIFRDSGGKGPIRVDLFDNGQPQSTEGYLVRYDLERDVALVSIYTNRPVQPAPLAPASAQPRKGDPVVNVGCPGGAVPSPLRSHILSVNGFAGAAKIQASGQPEIGRSGGGLFNAAGQVIGVCNFADPTDRAGLYANLTSTKQMFEAAGLAHIYQNASSSSADAIASTTSSNVPAMPKMPAMPGQPNSSGQALQSIPTSQAPGDSSATELICILRSPGNEEAPAEVIVIDEASKALLQQIAQERRANQGTFPTSKHSQR